MCCVDPVEIIKTQRRKISGAGGEDAVVRLLHSGEGGAELRIISYSALLDFAKRRQRDSGMQIIGQLKIVGEIRKNQNREIEARVQDGELRFLQLTAAIVGLQFRLDDVRVSHFAAMFEVLRELEELVTSLRGSCGGFEFVLCSEGRVVALYDGYDEAAGSNLRFGFGSTGPSGSGTVLRKGRDIQDLMKITLARVFVNGIVG